MMGLAVVSKAITPVLGTSRSRFEDLTMPPRFALSALATLLFISGLPHSLAGQAVCSRQALAKPPRWISTLELNSRANEVLVADPKGSELLAYDLKNWSAKTISIPVGLPPSSITKIEGGFLIKDRDDGAILNAEGKAAGALNLRQTKSGGGTGLGSLYSNWVTRGSRFVGFGSVPRADLANSQYDPSRGFQLGFVTGRVSADLGQFRDVELLEATENTDLYLLGFPYFAANDDGLFFVRMTTDEPAAIMRVKEGATTEIEELSAFPSEFRTVPKLGPNQGPSSTAARFAQVEQKKMVVGLFGQGKFLYLLAREPDGGDGQQWLIYKISPKESKPLGVVRLPTTANHLSVIPGADYWYVFERGVVRGWGDQDIKTVVKIPTAWIASPMTSPLRDLRVVPCKERAVSTEH
jgi:hypothetical protein